MSVSDESQKLYKIKRDLFCCKQIKHKHDEHCYKLFVYELDREYLLIETANSKEDCGCIIVNNYFNDNVVAFLYYTAISPFAMIFDPEFLGKSFSEVDEYKICGKRIMENIKKCNTIIKNYIE